jgi:hypothetical protein
MVVSADTPDQPKPAADGDPGDEQPEPRAPTEDEKVLSYRELMLMELGFNDAQAEAIAAAKVSWHEADALLRKGCDHHTVVNLLT